MLWHLCQTLSNKWLCTKLSLLPWRFESSFLSSENCGSHCVCHLRSLQKAVRQCDIKITSCIVHGHLEIMMDLVGKPTIICAKTCKWRWMYKEAPCIFWKIFSWVKVFYFLFTFYFIKVLFRIFMHLYKTTRQTARCSLSFSDCNTIISLDILINSPTWLPIHDWKWFWFSGWLSHYTYIARKLFIPR